MIDGGRAIGGAFLAVLRGAAPAWVASAGGAPGPVLSRPVSPGDCVEPAAAMRRDHPALLVAWRDQVVRRGDRWHRTADGRRLRVSLTRTCLGCHGGAAAFCDRCHEEAGITPRCWDCHPRSPEGAGSP